MEKNFDYYRNLYTNHLNIIKDNIKNQLDELVSKLEDKIDNIQSIIEKIDLNFDLPIEVPFEERLKIGINKKLSKMIDNLIKENNKSYIFLNLYKTNFKNLKLKLFYPNEEETISIKSEIPFNLKGIGIPKVSEEIQDKIDISLSIYDEGLSENKEPEKIIQFELIENEEKNKLTIGILENPVNIQTNKKYKIKISGIKLCTYIDNEEDYNIHNNILIESNNNESILSCLIIE